MTNNDITIRDLLSSFARPAPLLNTQIDRDELIYDDRRALDALESRLDAIFDTLDETHQTHLNYLIDDFHDDPFFHLANSDKFARYNELFNNINDFTPADYDTIITDDDLRSMIANEFADHTPDCADCAEYLADMNDD